MIDNVLIKYCLLFSVFVAMMAPGRSLSKEVSKLNDKICFVKNVGQIIDAGMVPVSNIDYRVRAKGVVLFVSNDMLQYQWYKTRPKTSSHKEGILNKKLPDSSVTDIYTMQVKLVGANKNAVPVAEEQQVYYESYYLSYCNGKTAYSYRKITYKDVYPDIDWVLYTVDGNVKYDFVVRPGGKISDIKLQYKNASSLMLKDGNLHAAVAIGNIIENKPYTYEAATKKVLPSSFLLKDSILTFDIKNNDNKNTIIIDPRINWCTYFGRDYYTVGVCTAADTFGGSYLCGYTDDVDFIASSGSYQSSFNGGVLDAWISHYNLNGTKVWSTYFGGEGNDRIEAAVTEMGGDLYVTGSTTSTTSISAGVNPQKRNFGYIIGSSYNDAFLARFRMDGSLNWCTYAGGMFSDRGLSVACDQAGDVYIGGTTNDTTTDSTGHYYKGYQKTPGPGFFSKYNGADGHRLWSSFINGDVYAVTTDNRGNLFVAGNTYIYTGIGYGSGYKTVFTSGSFNGYVCRFTTSTGLMSWGTYYGDSCIVKTLACDSFGSVYLTALNATDPRSPVSISTPGAHLTTRSDAIVTKFDSSCRLKWATYYPGDIRSLLLSPDHKIYLGGVTRSASGIATPDAYKNYVVGSDGYFAKFNIEGKRLYGTYIGGGTSYPGPFPGVEDLVTISYGGSYSGINGGNKLFIGGLTLSDTGLATSNAYQTQNNDTLISFIAQFYADTSVYIKFPYVDSILCAGGPLIVNYGVTNLFRPGNTFTVQLSDISGNFSNPVNVGSLSYNDRYTINCTIPLGTPEGVGYRIRIVSSVPADTFYNYDVPVRVSNYPAPGAVALQPVCANLNLTMQDSATEPADTKYTWLSPNPARSPGLSNPNIVSNITLADSGDYILIADNHSCIRRDTVHVHVTTAPPEPTITGDTSLCIGDTLKLVASSPVSGVDYFWFDPTSQLLSQQANIQVPAVTFADAGKYRVAAILNGCQSDPLYGQIVTVHPLPQPSANSNTPVCEGDTLRLTSTDTTNVSYAWSGPQGFMAARKDTIIANASAAADGTYAVKTTTIHGCVSTASTPVVIKPSPKIEALSNSPICEHDAMSLSVGNGAGNASYSWMGPGNYTANTQAATRPDAVLNQSGIYKVTATLNGCIREDTTVVVISEAPEKPQAGSNSPLFTGEVLKLSIGNAQNNISYNWTGPNGFISQLTNPVINKAIPAMSGVYTVIAQVGTCTAYDTIIVVVRDASGNNNKNDLLVFPNPNNGVFRVKGTTKENNIISLAVFASDGKRIYEASIQPVNNIIDETINIGTVANGVYRLKIWIDGKMIPVSFTVNR